MEARGVDALQVRRAASSFSLCFGLLQLLSVTTSSFSSFRSQFSTRFPIQTNETKQPDLQSHLLQQLLSSLHPLSDEALQLPDRLN